jgi:hypothetical protein
MFNDLDSTLAALLNDAPQVELQELRDAEVSFETPDRTFAPAQTTVDLFLCEVRENRELRDPTPLVERQLGVFVRRPPPVRTDCSYLVTAWSAGTTGAARTAAEHRLLGQALIWLSRFATIPTGYLQGGLGAPTRIYPLPMAVGQLDPDRQAGDFWVAMGIAPRAGFYLTVTTELPLAEAVEGPLVTTAEVGYQQAEAPATREVWSNFGGLVRDGAGAPVPGAWVRLEPAGLTGVTAADGRFQFTRVPPGTGYTLAVRAFGKADITRAIQVPNPTGEYDLQFP